MSNGQQTSTSQPLVTKVPLKLKAARRRSLRATASIYASPSLKKRQLVTLTKIKPITLA